jgi:hypothetical protein
VKFFPSLSSHHEKNLPSLFKDNVKSYTGISNTRCSSNVISPNGLLSSLWVWQHKDESNPFLFAT